MKKIINLGGLLFAFLFFSLPISYGIGTVVDLDVSQDTIWSKEMSPIYLKEKLGDKDKMFRVVNGATLTIEAGVVIILSKKMSFEVTNQCRKGYNSECTTDKDGKKILPKLLSVGNSEEPIVFTSSLDFGKKGDWGNFHLSTPGNVIEFTKFENGGLDKVNYFLDLYKDNIFENNLIKNIGNNALFLKSGTLKNILIDSVDGTGIKCETSCNIINNILKNIKKDSISAKISKESIFNNNIIKNSGGVGIKIENYYQGSVKIINNSFEGNVGGVEIYHNNNLFEISKNNFTGNKTFAIKNTTFSKVSKIKISGNYFGSKNGSSSVAGNTFVSENLETKHVKSKNNILNSGNFFLKTPSTSQSTVSQKDIIDFKLERTALFGEIKERGAIINYKVTLKNIDTAKLNNVIQKIQIPKDQEIISCSIDFSDNISQSYNLGTVCKNKVKYGINLQVSDFSIKLGNLSPGKHKKVFFSTVLKSSHTNGKTPKIPEIFLTKPNYSKKVNYIVGRISKISNVSSSQKTFTKQVEEKVEEKKSFFQKSKNVISKSISEIRAEIARRRELAKKHVKPIETPAKTPVNNEQVTFIETGVIKAQNWYGKLRFILTNERGEVFKLLNSQKWALLLSHIRSGNKLKQVRIYGEYYVNKHGKRTGIRFNHFHLK